MRRGYVAFGVLTLLGLALTGCGLFRTEQREAWRTQAEEACLAAKQVVPTAYMSRSSAIDGPGVCGISYPFKVAALAGGSVGLTSKATLGCPIIPRTDSWLLEVVQPAAQLYFGTAVAELRSGSYSCRSRNNQRGARLSEHAFGNAIDVMAFRLADGREVSVLKGWRGAPDEQEFLREVFVGACRYFNTVLGPGADMFHYDHFHIDLARHDPRGQRRICKPVLKFTPRLDAAAVAAAPRAAPPYGSASAFGTAPAGRGTWSAAPAARPTAAEPEPYDEGDEAEAIAAAASAPPPPPVRGGVPLAPSAPFAAPRPAPFPDRAAGPGPLDLRAPQYGVGVPIY